MLQIGYKRCTICCKSVTNVAIWLHYLLQICYTICCKCCKSVTLFVANVANLLHYLLQWGSNNPLIEFNLLTNLLKFEYTAMIMVRSIVCMAGVSTKPLCCMISSARATKRVMFANWSPIWSHKRPKRNSIPPTLIKRSGCLLKGNTTHCLARWLMPKVEAKKKKINRLFKNYGKRSRAAFPISMAGVR